MQPFFVLLLLPFLIDPIVQDSAKLSHTRPADSASQGANPVDVPDIAGEYECVETNNPAGCTLPGITAWVSLMQEGHSVVLQTMQTGASWNTVCQGEGEIVGKSIVISCACERSYDSSTYQWTPKIEIISDDTLRITNAEYYAIWRKR